MWLLMFYFVSLFKKMLLIFFVLLALMAEAGRSLQASFRTYRVQRNYAVNTGKW